MKKKAILKKVVLNKSIHPTRKILEMGDVVDGEAFDFMMKEESNDADLIKNVKEIKALLEEIAYLLGKKENWYSDSNIVKSED